MMASLIAFVTWRKFMRSLIIRWAINIIAVYIATLLIPHQVNFDGAGALAIFAIVLALVNAVIKPIVTLLSLPFLLATLGLFTLVINALMFWLASAIVPGCTVNGFGGAFLGALVVSVVSWLLSIVLPD